jgi:hypothetical protein
MANYTVTGIPAAQTRASSSQVRAEFTLIATAVNSKGDTAGQVWTGAHDYSAASSFKVPAPVNATDAVTKGYADNLAYATVLPGQAIGFLKSTGSVASFGTTHTGYAQNEVKGADIASAATINLTTATGNFVHVTGTTTVTAITIPVGAERTVIFDGVLTLTHGAALLLPGAANITTAPNDRMVVRGDAAGAVVVSYTKASGQAVMSLGDHAVTVNTGNGHGSTNTKIRRFTTTQSSTGTAITYADSATLGASFTINEAGLYLINYRDTSPGTAPAYVGVSLNSAQLTSSIQSITLADIVGLDQPATNATSSASYLARLAVNDIIRPHTDGLVNASVAGALCAFNIRKVAV